MLKEVDLAKDSGELGHKHIKPNYEDGTNGFDIAKRLNILIIGKHGMHGTNTNYITFHIYKNSPSTQLEMLKTYIPFLSFKNSVQPSFAVSFGPWLLFISWIKKVSRTTILLWFCIPVFICEKCYETLLIKKNDRNLWNNANW